MRHRTLVAILGVTCVVATVSCPPPDDGPDDDPAEGSGESPRALAVSVSVDGSIGVAPHTALLRASVSGETGDVTYVWDFGDGLSETSGAMTLHVYEEAGTYTATAMVTDDADTATGTVTIDVRDDLPQASETIGPSGGSVTLNAMTVTVPPNLLPDGARFTLTEIPAPGASEAKQVDGDGSTRFGPMYRLDTPVRLSLPFTGTFTYDALPDGVAPENVAVVVRSPGFPEVMPDGDDAPPPEVLYVPAPPVNDPSQGVVEFEIYNGSTFQLAGLDAPLEVVALDLAGDEEKQALEANVHFQVFPADRDAYLQWLTTGLNDAYRTLVSRNGFLDPGGRLQINVRRVSGQGRVVFNQPRTIIIDSRLSSFADVTSVLTHEFFHVLQLLSTNKVSACQFANEDYWFYEGSADWAEDLVYDFSSSYHAPMGSRFFRPLNAEGHSRTQYETVAFWKWLESTSPNAIRMLMEAQLLFTHDVTALPVRRENDARRSYTGAAIAQFSEVDYLDFFDSALYQKDFETDEFAPGELYDATRLGPPNALPVGVPRSSQAVTLMDGGLGDGVENAASVTLSLQEFLTADVAVIRNDMNDPVEGDLHVRFLRGSNVVEFADVAVLERFEGEVMMREMVRDVPPASGDRELMVNFELGSEVVIIGACPSLAGLPSPAMSNPVLMEVWVDSPCETPEANVVVSDTQQLVDALAMGLSGDVIRLMPGTYTPATRLWNVDRPEGIVANLALDGVTLIGSGEGSTILDLNLSVIPDDTFGLRGNLGIFIRGSSEIQRLTMNVRGAQGPAMLALNTRRFSICDVTVNNSNDFGNGLNFIADDGGVYTLVVLNSTFMQTSRNPAIGFDLSGCHLPTFTTIDAEVLETTITGYEFGVLYEPVEMTALDADTVVQCGSVNLDIDCENVTGNTMNVLACSQTDCVEMCP